MKTIEVTLPTPATIDGKEVTNLVFREPLGADIEAIIGSESVGKSITTLAASLCTSVALSEEDVRALPADDYLAISGVLMDFLG